MKSLRHLVTTAALAALTTGWVAPAMAQESITVWFTKGFYKGEDDALLSQRARLARAQPNLGQACVIRHSCNNTAK